ncbi:zinc finger protein 40 isoform X2 [Stegostoma tigrinum]|uniref:zinc finger protein 40 isoform X2 n=1 Tax=Stegostoma tigrinum TaxID=3053191 RepID=UPI00202B8D01|nr:zinc finger protein 40 isoform X2 [Stegostoma tigrinum]
MPRRKQVNPKPLRDKIQEAQKELQVPEDAQKNLKILEGTTKDSHDSQQKGKLSAVKGVKRKKVVAENITKKIPKSPVKARLKFCNDQQNVEAAFPVEGFETTSTLLEKEELVVQNGGLDKEGEIGQKCSQVLNLASEAAEARTERSTQRAIVPAGPSVEPYIKSPNSGAQQLETDATLKSLVSEKSPSLSNKHMQHQIQHLSLLQEHWLIKAEDRSCSTNGSFPCENTAFDVLLKAMEPELKTLSKVKFCIADPESRKSGITVGTQGQESSGISTFAAHTLNQTSVCKSEFTVAQQYYSNFNQIVSKSGTKVQPEDQTTSHLNYLQPQLVSQAVPQNKHHALLQRFNGSPTHQQDQTKHHFQPTYNLTVTSLGHFQNPVVSHRMHQSQLAVHPNQSMATNLSNCVQVGSGYKQHHVTPVVNFVTDQVSDILVKDQKPKKQGKYICEYCNRACAKPSVLQKHIRSHTGERPYPCVTCGFSFKTKSNLYKHKKSHAHAIKLGLVLRSGSSSKSMSQESDRALSNHSDVEESGESEAESTSEEKSFEQQHFELEATQATVNESYSDTSRFPRSLKSPDKLLSKTIGYSTYESAALYKSSESKLTAALPKVVAYPVNISPLRADSPKLIDTVPELATAKQQLNPQTAKVKSAPTWMSPLKKQDNEHKQQIQMTSQKEEKFQSITTHAHLQRQQATDFCHQQGKSHLSPRSLGSTDSGYFSRSESADQQLSPSSPYIKSMSTTEVDPNKCCFPCPPHSNQVMATVLQMSSVEKPSKLVAPVRTQIATKSLEERISKLISDNEAVVDDKQLDSVKPRRTSLSRRGSIDSPKPYTFKDSFQFDLRPLHSGRRTSSSSDIPKSPFTPTDKSKPVFLLSVPTPFPSLDCLPITRSNSMPATPAYSAVPTSIISVTHPLRECQSFDDKIGGSFSDDVFVSGPLTPLELAHPRTLVRQTAVEDSSGSEGQSFVSTRSMDEGCHSNNKAGVLMPRSKSFEHESQMQEKVKKSQGRGSMYECETCRNRYRKLENFENHRKFYCSELHGPKLKPAISKEVEQEGVSQSKPPQLLHYRVIGTTGVLQQPPKVRKRRKIKSIGDDDEMLTSDNTVTKTVSKQFLADQKINAPVSAAFYWSSMSDNITQTAVNVKNLKGQHLGAGSMEPSLETSVSFSNKIQTNPFHSPLQDKGDLNRNNSGVSVIQHTNSLSRSGCFEQSEFIDRISPVQENETPNGIVQPSMFVNTREDICCKLTDFQQLSNTSETVRASKHEALRSSVVDCTSLQQLRLVRQQNIQVPEILVTEEPDQEQESQGNGQEIVTEIFHWPQRSETLSKLPTEKLPPKKKRIRLAEMEHSSAESSFDSTLSRSFSQDSSLSCSSFSASFDKEDIPRTESPSKVETISKVSELSLINYSNTLGLPNLHYRGMRRVASEQSSCLPPFVEANSGIRSKSFDCTIISTSRCSSPEVPVEMISTVAPGLIGSASVSLIERRRGPLLRQMSLSIGPDISQTPVLPSNLLKQNVTLQVAALPQHTSSILHRSSPVSFLTSPHQLSCMAQIRHVVQHDPKPSIQDANVNNQVHVNSLSVLMSTQGNLKALPERIVTAHIAQQKLCPVISLPSAALDNTFAPKYQLQLVKKQPSQPYLLPTVTSQQSVIPLPVPNTIGSSVLTSNVSLQPLEIISNLYLLPPVQPVNSSRSATLASVVMPIGIQSKESVYNTTAITTLPQILVTQDQSNNPAVVICNLESVNLATDEEVPSGSHDYLEGQQCEISSKVKVSVISKYCISHDESKGSLVLSDLKIPSDGLLAQETTGTSKRMLSPANSLDIALENHQKRVKDENGSTSSGNVTPGWLHAMKSVEINNLKKPMLTRQFCTTDEIEDSLPVEQEGTQKNSPQTLELSSFPEISFHDLSISYQDKHPIVAREVLEPESSNYSHFTSSTVIRKSPISVCSSSPQVHTMLLKTASDRQDNKSPLGNDQVQPISNESRLQVGASFPVTSTQDIQNTSLSSLKTSTSSSWCYLTKCKPLQIQQMDKKTSAYATWHISPNSPNPLGLPTKVVLGLLNSMQKNKEVMYTEAKTTLHQYGILVLSSTWKAAKSKALSIETVAISEPKSKDKCEHPEVGDSDKEHAVIEPRRIRIFDGGYKSNEEYVYVRGRGRGKYICEECGIRCKKPSMLRKHIRTHTDLRPYHCNYCNFSFKTKGNLTKHMKSKAHSKKCMEMGVAVAPFEDHDTDETGDKLKGGRGTLYSDAEDSDGQDDEDYEVDDDEDSQGETGLSATPSVTASPQPNLQGNDQLGTLTDASISLAVSVVRTANDSTMLTNSFDVLSAVWLTQNANVETDKIQCKFLPVHPRAAEEDKAMSPSARGTLPKADQKCSGYQVISDNQHVQEKLGKKIIGDLKKVPSPISLPPRVQEAGPLVSTSPVSSPRKLDSQQQRQPVENQGLLAEDPPLHLFSHLPLHSQQQVKTTRSMIPVGGIQLGLMAYSTFVPIQTRPMQLTAFNIFHQSTSSFYKDTMETTGNTKPLDIPEENKLLPCIPLEQVNLADLQSTSSSNFETMNTSGQETLNLLGLESSNIGPKMCPSSLSVNAVGLQVLTTNPQTQDIPCFQAPVSGVQIMKLSTLIPSVTTGREGQTSNEMHCTTKLCANGTEWALASLPVTVNDNKVTCALFSQLSPQIEACALKELSDATDWKYRQPNQTDKADSYSNKTSFREAHNIKTAPAVLMDSELVNTEAVSKSPDQTLLPENNSGKPVATVLATVHYSDVSSDDEDRLVIAT